jgi:hypothetical protein
VCWSIQWSIIVIIHHSLQDRQMARAIMCGAHLPRTPPVRDSHDSQPYLAACSNKDSAKQQSNDEQKEKKCGQKA